MTAIHIHDTDTEELMGTVYPLCQIDSDVFHNIVERSWRKFNEDLPPDYTIDDFVAYHNRRCDYSVVSVKIGRLNCGLIQL